MNYIGSKAKLLDFLKSEIKKVAGEDLSQMRFCDLFAGTGAVGRSFKNEVKQVISKFGGVYLGFVVQEKALADFSEGKIWTPGTLLNEGHCVYAYAYDDTTVTVATWGAGQPGSWDWWDETVDEAYVLLSPETLVPGFCPGFDFAGFQKALKAVTA